MSHLGRYLKLDLPVLPSDMSVAWTLEEMQQEAKSDSPTMIRGIFLAAPTGYSLQKTLEIADDMFLGVAEKCRAVVVAHDFALKEVLPGDRNIKPHPHNEDLIPQGYALVAAVETVKNARSPVKDPDVRERIETGLAEHTLKDPFVWYEGYPGQFLQGNISEETGDQLFLTDIEPRYCINNRKGLPAFLSQGLPSGVLDSGRNYI